MLSNTKYPKASDYAPYHTFDGFAIGYNDYLNHRTQELVGVEAQAYDRGAEFAMRCERFLARMKEESMKNPTLAAIEIAASKSNFNPINVDHTIDLVPTIEWSAKPGDPVKPTRKRGRPPKKEKRGRPRKHR